MKFSSLDPTNLFELYKLLTPQDLAVASRVELGLSPEGIENAFINTLIPSDGSFVTSKTFIEKIKTSLAGVVVSGDSNDGTATISKDSLRSLDEQYHMCTSDKSLDFFDASKGGALNYWTSSVKDHDSKQPSSSGEQSFFGLRDIMPGLLESDKSAPNKDKTVSCFVVKNPYCSPTRKSVDQIDFFMNHIPTIHASQMVPYLDVQFEVEGTARKSSDKGDKYSVLQQPSIIRFLYGSGVANEPGSSLQLSDGDDAMLQLLDNPVDLAATKNTAATDAKPPESTSAGRSFAGMEMFLMPQTLTNMETLKANGSTKVTDSKAFLPFASLESFNVQIMNAGAGAIARKKGSLKIKIHDKSRIVEMADFLRGPQGYGRSRAKIWTTYGWLSQRGAASENAYSKFINDSMMTTDCWMVMNTQYAFDGTGQCSLTLDLLTQSTNKTYAASINSDPRVAAKLKELEDIVSFIQKIKTMAGDIKGDMSDDIRPIQVLEAGAKGDFPDLKNAGASINSLIRMIHEKGTVPESELRRLQDELNKLYTGKNALGKSYKDDLDDVIASGVKNMLTNAQRGPDPFLARPGLQSQLGTYFRQDLIEQVDIARKRPTPDTRSNSSEGSKPASKAKIEIENKVVSFGKLFLNTIVPALLVGCEQDEIQVIFYMLNDKCGPLSNQSVAEIPIDMRKFAYAYNDAIATSMRTEMTLESFFNLLVNNQVSSNEAIGYGMQEAFEPFDPANKEAKKKEESAYNAKITEWTAKYGILNRPVVEMFIEVGDTAPPDTNDPITKLRRGRKIKSTQGENEPYAGRVSVMRVHVFDKTIRPYDLVSSLIDTGDSWTLGKYDTSELEKYARSVSEANKEKVAKMSREEFYNYVKQESGLGDTEFEKKYGEDTRKSPYGTKIQIRKGDTKAIKEYISLTVPTMKFGVNGSMISSANLASKTDGALAAANLMSAVNSAKGASGTATPPLSGLEGPSGLPVRMIPAQLSVTSMGCPIAQLYQQYYIDFQTGTSIDNLYTVTQITHDISPGKFNTNWTFMYTDGYGKFGAPPVLRDALTGAVNKIYSQVTMPKETSKAAGGYGAGGGGGGGGSGGGSGSGGGGAVSSANAGSIGPVVEGPGGYGVASAPPGTRRLGSNDKLPSNTRSAIKGMSSKPWGSTKDFVGSDGLRYVAVTESHRDDHTGAQGEDRWHPGVSVFIYLNQTPPQIYGPPPPPPATPEPTPADYAANQSLADGGYSSSQPEPNASYASTSEASDGSSEAWQPGDLSPR
jgi:uncharacterized membrane protein YgcG